MALSEIDRGLLKRCLERQPGSWGDFANRFLGLVVHVVNHTAQSRNLRLQREDVEDLAADVFVEIIRDDFAVLRRFRGSSSLATYLTVIARRVVVREILRKQQPATGSLNGQEAASTEDRDVAELLQGNEQVEQILAGLRGPVAEVVRLYHLEGQSYQEISRATGIPVNSIGPMLKRARDKMRSMSLS